MEAFKPFASAIVSVIIIGAGLFNLTLDEGILNEAVTSVIVIAVAVYDIWKNHNFTDAAKIGQHVTDAIKSGEVNIEDADLEKWKA